MSGLSTHVLDQVNGIPAMGIKVEVFHDDNLILQAVTNEDGRCDNLHGQVNIRPGRYRLSFAIGDYFIAKGTIQAPAFFDIASVEFFIEKEGGKYHVPLLASPFGYSTYRGS